MAVEVPVVLRCSEWSVLEFYACSVCSLVFADADWCEDHERRCRQRIVAKQTVRVEA